MEPNQSRIINIPASFNGRQRESIGRDIIRRIRERTSLGLDVNNNLFSAYSPNYEKTGRVNLSVSGETLQGLSVLSHGVGFIRIGFNNSVANDKAAYIQAPRGRKAGSQPVRRFVGINQRDLNNILRRHTVES